MRHVCVLAGAVVALAAGTCPSQERGALQDGTEKWRDLTRVSEKLPVKVGHQPNLVGVLLEPDFISALLRKHLPERTEEKDGMKFVYGGFTCAGIDAKAKQIRVSCALTGVGTAKVGAFGLPGVFALPTAVAGTCELGITVNLVDKKPSVEVVIREFDFAAAPWSALGREAVRNHALAEAKKALPEEVKKINESITKALGESANKETHDGVQFALSWATPPTYTAEGVWVTFNVPELAGMKSASEVARVLKVQLAKSLAPYEANALPFFLMRALPPARSESDEKYFYPRK
jgi:hypothetical protein